MVFIAYCVLLVALPTAVELIARGRGVRGVALLGLVLGELLGVVVAGLGLLVLAYNGSIQDVGEQSAHTTRLALPIIGIGLAIAVGPWLSLLVRRS
jgi:hypothetical protein